MQPHLGSVMGVVTAGLGDAREPVHTAALRSIEPLLPLLAASAGGAPGFGTSHDAGSDPAAAKAAGQQLVAALLTLGSAALAAQPPGEEALVLACQALQALVESPAPLMGAALPGALELAMRAAIDARLEGGVREQALQVLHVAAR